MALIDNAEFWKALGALFWPATILFIFSREHIFKFLNKEGLSIKMAGMEISVADATKNIGSDVADLQKKLSELEAIVKGQATGKDVQEFSQQSSTHISDRMFTILWVDDYPINNAFLVENFRKEGVNIKLSLSTKDALDALTANDIDIIITDLGRREGGIENNFAGSDLIKLVRQKDENIPILVFAGQRGLDNRSRLLREGANGVTASGVEVQSFVNNHRGNIKKA